MLRPRAYPELIGKALVLEAQAFENLADDDEPWVEGFFLIVVLGVAVGLARWFGGLLLTSSLPPSIGVIEALVNGWQQWNVRMALSVDPVASEGALRQTWTIFTLLIGYGGGWARLLSLVIMPLAFVVQWLLAGLLVYLAARSLGGTGSLNQTLGATALMVAPNVLLLLQAIPFVSVSGLLLAVWSLLILYRATEITHNLAWSRALWAAITPYLALALLLLLLAGLTGIGLWLGGWA
jgi:hypothetical protein